MVDINLTLFIELGLFLIFMWAMGKYVFRPLLKVMDARAWQIEEDKRHADSVDEEAAALEQDYAKSSAGIHRNATERVRQAHRKAQRAHLEKVTEFKAAAQRELEQARAEAEKLIAAQRSGFPALADALAGEIAARLDLDGNAS